MTWFIFLSVSYTAEKGSADAGKYGADFLSIGVGARALALGGASVALTGDATGTYWNPAAIFHIERGSLSLMHSKRFSRLETYNFASVVSKMGPLGNFGVSWIRLGIDDIPIYGELSGSKDERLANPDLQPSAEPEGYLQDVENAIFLSYGTAPTKPILILNVPVTFSWGANAKYIFTRLGDKRCRGIGFDAGMLFSYFVSSRFRSTGNEREKSKAGNASLGIVFQDAFNTILKWNTKHEDIIPTNMKIGVAYTSAKGILSKFTFVFDLESRYGWMAHAGLEYRIVDFLTVRAGLHQTDLTMGAGLRIKNFSVDYAFTGEDLANSHQISLSARL